MTARNPFGSDLEDFTPLGDRHIDIALSLQTLKVSPHSSFSGMILSPGLEYLGILAMSPIPSM